LTPRRLRRRHAAAADAILSPLPAYAAPLRCRHAIDAPLRCRDAAMLRHALLMPLQAADMRAARDRRDISPCRAIFR